MLDREYAEFVVRAGVSFTPAEYLSLTRRQRDLLIAEANRR